MSTKLILKPVPVILSLCLLLAAAYSARPATLVVTNSASLGPGTLRQALMDNLAMGGGHTVVFAANLASTITLLGELSVNAPVTILGPGPNLLAINGNNLSRIFTVTAGPTLISGLTIRNGQAVGSPGNQMQDGTDAFAGGIYNVSTLTLSNCVVRDNIVVGGQGGPRAQGTVGRGGRAYGAGIYNQGGTLILIETVLERNRATGGAGGNASGGGGSGGAGGLGGDAFGGAVYTINGTNRIFSCQFESNSVAGGAGGIGAPEGPAGQGGQGSGAGLYSQSPTLVLGSTFYRGAAMGGSSATANGSGFGGGIATISSLTLLTSTVVSNSATGSSFDLGGGIFNGGDLGITNCTLVGNQADSGGGLWGTAFVGGSIIAGNAAVTGPDVSGAFTSADYNLIQNTNAITFSGSTAHLIIGQDPLLGNLQDNGGRTRTMALQPGSPAIDQGNSFGLSADQRGVTRPYNWPSVADAAGGNGADIGAYEFVPVTRLNIQSASNNTVALSWSNDAGNFRLQSTTNLANAVWTDVLTPRTVVGNQVYTTNSTLVSPQLYRLTFP